MKISYRWLLDYLQTEISVDKAAELLTGCGLEVELVEEFETIEGGLKEVVMGKVLTCAKHPDADRLSLTTVDVGTEAPLQIVCGAHNVRAGQTVVVAKVGAVLHPSYGEAIKIKRSKIRGVESCGMICAQDELGLGDSHDGIMVIQENIPAGTPAAEYFGILKDFIFEIGITPNRSDALSHVGVARDLNALINLANNTSLPLKLPDVSAFQPQIELDIKVTVEAVDDCPRYAGLSIKGVKVGASPAWLQDKLNSIGVRPVNNIVDATQFVLFELGQPLHAFDADKIVGKEVIVKKLWEDKKMVTLDGIERKIDEDDLMICNIQAPMCFAGVMGGLESSVTEQTANIFLESAAFDAVSIRRTAKLHALKTDASFRYERGCDPTIARYAIQRAALLIKELAGGQISQIVDFYPSPEPPQRAIISTRRVSSLVGKQIEQDVIVRVLEAIDINCLILDEDALMVEIPACKVDVYREEDVVEEFLRIYGYNNIEIPTTWRYAASDLPQSELIALEATLSQYLSNNGFFEAMNNSLTKADYLSAFKCIDPTQTVSLLNPLSRDLENLRQTLLPGLLENVINNINHGITDVKLYEFGKIYCRNADANQSHDVTQRFTESSRLSLCMTGKWQQNSWHDPQTDVDFFHLKNIICNALSRISVNLDTLETSTFASTDALDNVLIYSINNRPFLTIGQVKSAVLKTFDLKQKVFFADLDADLLPTLTKNNKTVYQELNKFPEVERDLALLVDSSVTYRQLEQLAFRTEPKRLLRVNLFDLYQGSNLPEGKKSYGLRFILYDINKTLTNQDITFIMEKLISAYRQTFHAELR